MHALAALVLPLFLTCTVLQCSSSLYAVLVQRVEAMATATLPLYPVVQAIAKLLKNMLNHIPAVPDPVKSILGATS